MREIASAVMQDNPNGEEHVGGAFGGYVACISRPCFRAKKPLANEP